MAAWSCPRTPRTTSTRTAPSAGSWWPGTPTPRASAATRRRGLWPPRRIRPAWTPNRGAPRRVARRHGLSRGPGRRGRRPGSGSPRRPARPRLRPRLPACRLTDWGGDRTPRRGGMTRGGGPPGASPLLHQQRRQDLPLPRASAAPSGECPLKGGCGGASDGRIRSGAARPGRRTRLTQSSQPAVRPRRCGATSPANAGGTSGRWRCHRLRAQRRARSRPVRSDAKGRPGVSSLAGPAASHAELRGTQSTSGPLPTPCTTTPNPPSRRMAWPWSAAARAGGSIRRSSANRLSICGTSSAASHAAGAASRRWSTRSGSGSRASKTSRYGSHNRVPMMVAAATSGGRISHRPSCSARAASRRASRKGEVAMAALQGRPGIQCRAWDR